MAVEQRIDPSLHLEIREPSTFCKSVCIWWLVNDQATFSGIDRCS
jgi:hypothetical protein